MRSLTPPTVLREEKETQDVCGQEREKRGRDKKEKDGRETERQRAAEREKRDKKKKLVGSQLFPSRLAMLSKMLTSSIDPRWISCPVAL